MNSGLGSDLIDTNIMFPCRGYRLLNFKLIVNRNFAVVDLRKIGLELNNKILKILPFQLYTNHTFGLVTCSN